jgi:hypothetical protein
MKMRATNVVMKMDPWNEREVELPIGVGVEGGDGID